MLIVCVVMLSFDFHGFRLASPSSVVRSSWSRELSVVSVVGSSKVITKFFKIINIPNFNIIALYV